MENSSLKEPCPKFNKTLIRCHHQKELKTDKELQLSEKSHLLKYFPKYYSHLNLRTGHESPLLLKIKRIKKLGKLTVNFEKKIPEELCRTLLGNHRKNMKELPQILCKYPQTKLKRLALWKIKSFPNITRLFFPKRKVEDSDDFLIIRKSFMRYLRNMRRLRIFEIILKDDNSQWMKWMEEKLNGMPKSLGRLEVLRMEICDKNVRIPEVFNYKDLMAQLTNLRFSFHMMEFNPSLTIIPEICKKLIFFGMSLKSFSESDRTKFESFLTCMKELPNLHSLGVDSSLLLFDFFKPKSSQKSKCKWSLPEQLPKWPRKQRSSRFDSKMIKELDEIEFNLKCSHFHDLSLSTQFMSKVLGTAQKLRSFKCSIQEDGDNDHNLEELTSTGLPFSIVSDCVSLEKIEYTNQSGTFSQFDLKKLMKFPNLRIIKLDVQDMDDESIEGMVSLLQKNQKEGIDSLLQLKFIPKGGSKWFEDIIKMIRNAKDNEGNLKIVLDFKFPEWFEHLDDYCMWETCADVITEGGIIKGLFAHFWLSELGPEFELLEVFDGRVKVIEVYRNDVLYQNPDLYII